MGHKWPPSRSLPMPELAEHQQKDPEVNKCFHWFNRERKKLNVSLPDDITDSEPLLKRKINRHLSGAFVSVRLEGAGWR